MEDHEQENRGSEEMLATKKMIDQYIDMSIALAGAMGAHYPVLLATMAGAYTSTGMSPTSAKVLTLRAVNAMPDGGIIIQ